MKWSVVLICSAALGLASVMAAAQQKTAKQCNDEWTANKAAIQSSGKTKKAFVAECRGQAAAMESPATKPTTAAPKPPRTAAPSVTVSVKSAKQCNDEWTANKAAIQASKKTKKQFMAECRAQPPGASPTTAAPSPAPPPSTPAPARPSIATPPTTPPAANIPARQPSAAPSPAITRAPATTTAPIGAGQFSTEAQAKGRCPGDTVVWVNLDSKIYHFTGARNYGKTKSGAYMCEGEAMAAGARAAKNEKHP